MGREVRAKKLELLLTVDPASPGKISLSTREAKEDMSLDDVPPLRYRRRTTSFKAKRPSEQRRQSLPMFNKYHARPKSTKRSVFQRIGSRLAKVGDDLLKRNCKTRGNLGTRRGSASADVSKPQGEILEHYASQLSEVGDYLNCLYSNETSLIYSESRYAALADNCLFLTTTLIALRNSNVVVINESDLETLSSLCRAHRVKSISRNGR